MQLDYNKIFINTEIEEYSEIFSDPFYRGYIEGFIEGYYQGVEEERERWKIKIVSNCLKQNLSLEEISSIVDISVKEVKQYIKENHLN
ncbi:hypothetical protein [Holdemanella sp.]|uniref:hypothetical protein n=1 Tax=Holdemanella sp. TaxID=1971762 RepID=UPI0025846CDD|nr:hypothetical protein [Holdemanella sp.]